MSGEVEKMIDELLGSSEVKQDVIVYSGVTRDPRLIVKEFFHSDDAFCISEGFDGIHFVSKPNLLFDNVARLRVFSGVGDLEVWRQLGSFAWRFVSDTVHMQGKHNQIDLCSERYFFRERHVNLWGRENRNGHRHEPRVASASLDYPIPNKTDLVRLKLIEYSKDGVVQFVRYVSLETGGS